MHRLALVALALAATLGCWNYRSQLDRAEAHFHAGRYDDAVINLSDLEPSLDALDRADRARYGYVRGLSHARLGQRADARHWLAVTREVVEAGAPLPDTERVELQRALAEADWISVGDRSADTPSVPSGTEPLDTTPPRTAQRAPSPRE